MKRMKPNYFLLTSVRLNGKPINQTCSDAMRLVVYEVGIGRSIALTTGERVKNPGWTLAEARQRLGGHAGVLCDKHGCGFEFSLEPWRGVPPTAWRVVPWFAEGGAGQDRHPQPSLAAVRRQLGADKGIITDPSGRPHQVDLSRFAAADEDLTHVALNFADPDTMQLSRWRRLFWRWFVEADEDRRWREEEAVGGAQ